MSQPIRFLLALAAGLCLLGSSGCTVTASEGYGYNDGAGYYGYAPVRGGWGPDYHVGPVREDYHHDEPHGGPPPRGPPPRPVPSIPNRPQEEHHGH